MTTYSDALLDHLATVANHTLHHHWHEGLCACDQPDNCPRYPAGTWNIGDSLRLVLPQLLTAYDQHKEQL